MDPGANFDDAVLGAGLPPAVEQALREAGASRSQPAVAMAALMRAAALAPDHPAVLTAFYRHYFYGHRLRLARAVARRCLSVAAPPLGLPAAWREVPDVALAGAGHHPSTRFYLWVLKALAYLSLRLGDEDEARAALAKLRALDPRDFVGAAVLEAARLRRSRARAGDDEDEDDLPALPAPGADAWNRIGAQPAAARVAP